MIIKSKKLKQDITWSTLGSAASIFSELLRLILVLFIVDSSVYGDYIVLMSISFIYIGILRAVPEGIVVSDNYIRKEYSANQFYVNLIVLITIIMIHTDYLYIIIIVLSGTFSSISRSESRRNLKIKKIIISNIISSIILSAILLLYGLLFKISLLTLVLISSLSLIFGELILYNRKNVYSINLCEVSFNAARFGIIRAIESMILVSFKLGDKLILSSFLTSTQVANYSVASNLGRKFDEKLLPIINNIAFPYLAKAKRDKRLDKERTLISGSAIYSIALMIALPLFIVGHFIYPEIRIKSYAITFNIISLSALFGSIHVYENLFKHHSLALRKPEKVLYYNGIANTLSVFVLFLGLSFENSIENSLKYVVILRLIISIGVSNYLIDANPKYMILIINSILLSGLMLDNSLLYVAVFVLSLINIIKLYEGQIK